MTEKRHIPGFVYKLMLLAATIIWGFAFVVMKDAVDVLPPAQLIGVRFFLTGLLMAAVFHRSLKGALNGPCLKAGLVLAVVTFLAFWVQTVGLADTTPGKTLPKDTAAAPVISFLMKSLLVVIGRNVYPKLEILRGLRLVNPDNEPSKNAKVIRGGLPYAKRAPRAAAGSTAAGRSPP